MRAAVLHTLAQPPAYAEHPDPVRGAGQTLVRVTAAPIVPLDQLCASGSSYFGPPVTPYVPGVQGVGVVVDSDAVAVGTRVWFATSAGMTAGDGGLAERCVVADDDVVAVSDDIDDHAVAALGLSGVAAWSVLNGPGTLAIGDQALVLGGGSVVGQVAIQLARRYGARRVVAAARSARARAVAAQAGADAVVELPSSGDPRDPAAVAALAEDLAAAGDGPYDVVVDPLCGLPATAAARLLARHGHLVNLGSSAGPDAVWDSALLRSRSASVIGYTNNDLSVAGRRAALEGVLGHAASGTVSVRHELVPLSDVAHAWARQQSGDTDGRIVVTI